MNLVRASSPISGYADQNRQIRDSVRPVVRHRALHHAGLRDCRRPADIRRLVEKQPTFAQAVPPAEPRIVTIFDREIIGFNRSES